MLVKKKLLKFDRNKKPFKSIATGFLFYIIIGVLLISLPFAQKIPVSFVDNLFNVVSAMSTTGLTTGSISELYTPFGKLILLGLIQLGAIGYMTLTSFLILSRKDKMPTHRVKVLSAEFSIPQEFNIKQFIKNIIIYTFSVELIGTLLLYWQFSLLGLEKPLWSAFFHSISTFATAGFSIYSDSLMRFQDNTFINIIFITLMYAGSIGFIVPMDVYRKLRGESKNITLTSRIIIIITALVAFIGVSVYAIDTQGHLLHAFFQVASASTTAGYNTVDLAKLPNAAIFILIFVMIIGASPAGTGGGIKTTTLSALLGVIGSVLRGHPEKITFFNHEIPSNRVMTAVATSTLYVLVLTAATLMLCLFDSHTFIESLFETTSALGTVGLSLGITPDLTNFSKIVLVLTMYLGRVGPLTLGLAFFKSSNFNNHIIKKTDLAV